MVQHVISYEGGGRSEGVPTGLEGNMDVTNSFAFTMDRGCGVPCKGLNFVPLVFTLSLC